MFIDRNAELAFLNALLTRQHPGPGQFVMLYGRRRVGKTALLRFWAEQTGLPFTSWVAEKEPGALQRRKLFTMIPFGGSPRPSGRGDEPKARRMESPRGYPAHWDWAARIRLWSCTNRSFVLYFNI